MSEEKTAEIERAVEEDKAARRDEEAGQIGKRAEARMRALKEDKPEAEAPEEVEESGTLEIKLKKSAVEPEEVKPEEVKPEEVKPEEEPKAEEKKPEKPK